MNTSSIGPHPVATPGNHVSGGQLAGNEHCPQQGLTGIGYHYIDLALLFLGQGSHGDIVFEVCCLELDDLDVRIFLGKRIELGSVGGIPRASVDNRICPAGKDEDSIADTRSAPATG